MNGLGAFGIAAGALQLIVPSYALRLVRRFGTQQVGWFVVAAFTSLALLHLASPRHSAGAGVPMDLVFACASALLLVGMCHLETLLSQREQAHHDEQRLRQQAESELHGRTAELTRTNEELFNEVARLQASLEIAQQSEALFRLLFDQNPQPMWIFDLRSLKFLAVNREALQRFGLSSEEALSLTVRELIKPEAVGGFLRDVARPCSSGEFRGIWPLRRKDGALLDAEITALDLRYADCPARLILTPDVTQRRRRELKVRETLKTELLGQMAQGVSGHFSQIFSFLDYQTNLLLQQFHPPATLARLHELSSEAARGSALSQRLQAVGSRGDLPMEVLQLGALIGKVEPALRQTLGPRISLQHSWEPALPPILGDSALLQQILTDLALNAREAMPQGGTVHISSTTEKIEEPSPAANPEARTGEFVRLTFSDTGSGMVPEVRARLFEPFFTTKAGSSHAGLGLAAIKGIVRQHRGWIDYSTQLDVGTEFNLYFPVAPRAAQAVQGALPEMRKGILLVETNDQLRAMARFTLERHGYRVIEADCVNTVLTLWDRQACQVDVLLSGMSIDGGLSGPELAARLRQTRPELREVYFADVAATKLPEGQLALSQPCGPDDILKAVETCLAGKVTA